MKFIFADSLDYVDPAFDFIGDRSPAERQPYWDDAYPHEILGYAPYDWVLISRGIVGDHRVKGKYTASQARRFRLVGATGFMGVLTSGLFALSLVPIMRTSIPGAVRYTVVYDNGANQAVVAVAPEITETELEATLRQAAGDLFSLGRYGGQDNQFMIRARTIIHPSEGLSKPLFLGQVKRSLAVREDENMQVELFRQNFAELPSDRA